MLSNRHEPYSRNRSRSQITGSPTSRPVERNRRKRRPSYKSWLTTFTKKAVALILVISLVDLQLSYLLAFMGREIIAESLSSTIAETVIGVMIGYFIKALFETFLEEREKRLKGKDPESSDENDPVG